MNKDSKANQIPKAFDSKAQEESIYTMWEQSGYFKPENMEKLIKERGQEAKKPFVMTLPPPNANGDLHMGHTCGYSFHDAMARYKRMTGHPTLLIAGKDHAGIQTETVFSKILAKKGIDKWELGREEFYKQCYEFTTNAADNARTQEKRIGLSADWDREFFTLDPRLTKTVYSTFYSMQEEGLIYRGKRITNHCPSCRTALADIDTEHKEMRGIFAYIVYPFVDEADKKLAKERFGVEGITIATTRPETMLGDTAVAVHPEDKRYKEFIGKKVLLPIQNIEIPVIGDDSLDMEKGSGALKVTPAHSDIDNEIGTRHNLPAPNVINNEAKMTGDIPQRFIGMDTIDASKAIVGELDKLGLLVKIENIKHDVAVCERCGTPVQPLLTYQWFVNTDELAAKANESLKNGDTKVMPSGQQKALSHFFENIQPWCISRQLWWGHRIPVWYSGSKDLHDWLLDNEGKSWEDYEKETKKEANGSGAVFTGEDQPKEDPNFEDAAFEQESDVLDTWFSSGQWPFSTTDVVGEEYFPTDVMVHGRDILFWWTGRMMMMGHYKKGKTPFHTVFLHGIINAPDGTKMSKSKGNTISPTKLFDEFGVDSLRLWYYTDALPGANAPLREEKIKGNRNFVNKIWNASRFVLMNINDDEIQRVASRAKHYEDHVDEIRSQEFDTFKEEMISYYEKHRYNLAAETAREFFWHTYCDVWIEKTKTFIDLNVGKRDKDQGYRVIEWARMVYFLKESLKIMHPMIPYITEAVWQELVTLGLAEGVLMVEDL